MSTSKDNTEEDNGKDSADDAESDLPLGRTRPKRGLSIIPPKGKNYDGSLSPHERFTNNSEHP